MKTPINTTKKDTSLVVHGAIAALLMAAVSANAISFTTGTVTFGSPVEIQGTAYNGSILDSSLLSGSTQFNKSLYSISSATMTLEILNASGHAAYLDFGNPTDAGFPWTPGPSNPLAQVVNIGNNDYVWNVTLNS
jgi:hypothetical protein